MFVELCCGSAGLTAQFERRGCRSMGFDRPGNQHLEKATVFHIDLASAEGRKVLDDLVDDPSLSYVHVALPCGTATAARNKPVPVTWVPGPNRPPRPLRSKDRPWGLPDLDVEELRRVELAKDLYIVTAEFLRRCHTRGVKWSLENPRTSLLWDISVVKDLADLPGVWDYDCDGCMHGGTRAKHHRFRSNFA